MESNRKKDPKLTEFLRRIIQDSGFTYESIAEMLDVSTRTVGYYCNGERKPGQKTLLRLIRIANVNVKDIPF